VDGSAPSELVSEDPSAGQVRERPSAVMQRHEVAEQTDLVLARRRLAITERPPRDEEFVGVGELPDVAAAPVRDRLPGERCPSAELS
jgi:hypothetical protein